MSKIIIHGPCKLKGKVKVQGAKNAAMKHLFIPLLSNDKFTIHNVPKIGTINKLLELVQLQGAKLKWKKKNTIVIDTTNVKESVRIPADIFYYTSGGIFSIPILASKYGRCIIEKDKKRDDYGGDQIGGRAFSQIIRTLNQLGIKCNEEKDTFIFSKVSDKPFKFVVPVESFSASVLTTFCALFKNGESKVFKYTPDAEFADIIEFLQRAGAKIKKNEDSLIIKGNANLNGIEYTTMGDRHDFATWVSAALITNSQIEIQNIDYKKMRLDAMDKVANQMGINLEYSENSCLVKTNLSELISPTSPTVRRESRRNKVKTDKGGLKPVSIHAGRYPDFQTEWQVLFSPIFTQIKGKSRVVEKLFPDRMQHWKELEKMGAKFKFIKTEIIPEFPYTGTGKRPPNAVEVTGPVKLKGAKVQAQDVRSGAALIIAGLAAEGKTEISDIEHIERGYEDIVGRLQKLGAKIEIL